MRPYLPAYVDGQLADVALALASAGDRAVDYLAQAPVLALLTPAKYRAICTYGDVDRFRALTDPGPALKVVLKAQGGALPMRKLRADTVRVHMYDAIAALAQLDNSTLSQCIPDNPEAQYWWLRSLQSWCERVVKHGAVLHFRWAAMALRDVEHGATIIGDFILRGDKPFSEKWSYARALEQSEAWHHRLNNIRRADHAARKGPDPHEVICRSKLPDDVEVQSVRFRVLRTRAALAEEGKSMHHCVSSYAPDVKKGRCAIVSAFGVSERATIEIVDGKVVQIKGVCNRAPSSEMVLIAGIYAMLHGAGAQA